MVSQLRIVSGADKGKILLLEEGVPLLLGRSRHADVRLNDMHVSRVHYEVGPLLARGQSGLVFRAKDFKDDTDVALKVLWPMASGSNQEVRRLVRSVKTMLPLKHPNLVALRGAGKTGPYCWIAMELVEGESLTQVIQRIGVAKMLDWRHAYRVALHIGQALEYAHGHQIIHRN